MLHRGIALPCRAIRARFKRFLVPGPLLGSRNAVWSPAPVRLSAAPMMRLMCSGKDLEPNLKDALKAAMEMDFEGILTEEHINAVVDKLTDETNRNMLARKQEHQLLEFVRDRLRDGCPLTQRGKELNRKDVNDTIFNVLHPAQSAQSTQASRFKPRSYKMDQDGDVVQFTDGEKPSAMFGVGKVVPRLTQWVEQCIQGKRKNGILTINGLVKTGKSAALMDLLPQIIAKQMPQAQIWALDFSAFLNPRSGPDVMEANLCRQVFDRAQSAGIPLGPRTSTNITLLMESLQASSDPIFFLIDEVQRYFQTGNETPNYAVFKNFLQINNMRPGVGVHFALTGSGMVQAWIHFLLMPTNGYGFLGSAFQVDIPTISDESDLDRMKRHLLASVGAGAQDELEGLLELRSVPMMAYVAEEWGKQGSVEDALKVADNKLRSEFQDDMLPVLQNMEAPQRQYIRKLAKREATVRPTAFFNTDTLAGFLDRCLVEKDGKFGFPDSVFAQCVADAVDTQGNLSQATVLPILLFQQMKAMVPVFQALGEAVKPWTKQDTRHSSGDKTEMKMQREQMCQQVHIEFEEHLQRHSGRFDVTSAITELYGYNNDQLQQKILDGGGLEKQRDLNCIYLRLYRNAAAHQKLHDNTRLRRLALHLLPPRARELAEKLESIVRDFSQNRLRAC